jgi:signal peptidase II
VTRMARLLLIAVITFASAGCDQAAKHIARNTLGEPGSISLLNDTVRLALAENRGAFLSLGSDFSDSARRFLFVSFASVLLAAIAIASLFGPNLGVAHVVGLALVLGGGVGNLIDRLLRDGVVTDFVQIGIGSLRTGIFNLSDLAIVLGVACFALARDPAAKPRAES